MRAVWRERLKAWISPAIIVPSCPDAGYDELVLAFDEQLKERRQQGSPGQLATQWIVTRDASMPPSRWD